MLCICICEGVCICISICKGICICICEGVCICMYMYMYIHTYIYIITYIYICVRRDVFEHSFLLASLSFNSVSMRGQPVNEQAHAPGSCRA